MKLTTEPRPNQTQLRDSKAGRDPPVGKCCSGTLKAINHILLVFPRTKTTNQRPVGLWVFCAQILLRPHTEPSELQRLREFCDLAQVSLVLQWLLLFYYKGKTIYDCILILQSTMWVSLCEMSYRNKRCLRTDWLILLLTYLPVVPLTVIFNKKTKKQKKIRYKKPTVSNEMSWSGKWQELLTSILFPITKCFEGKECRRLLSKIPLSDYFPPKFSSLFFFKVAIFAHTCDANV